MPAHPSPAVGDDTGRRLSPLAQLGLLAGPVLSMVDSSVVNVAIPDIAARLRSPLATVQWTASGYLLALAAALAASPYLARRFGTRRVYLLSLCGFTAASALCALAPGVGFLIAARVLQGALAAPMLPLAMGMLMGRSSGAVRRQISPAIGMAFFLAPTLGPTLGGVLIAAFGWPAIFLINVPLGAAGALGTLRLPDSLVQQPDPRARLDLLGLALLGAGLGLASYGLSQAPLAGWTARGSWPFWAGGIALLAAYAGWALRHPRPAVDLALLRHGQAALAVGLSLLASVVTFAMLFLLPVVMQQVQGVSALATGLAMLPQGVAMALGSVLGSRLSARATGAALAGAVPLGQNGYKLPLASTLIRRALASTTDATGAPA